MFNFSYSFRVASLLVGALALAMLFAVPVHAQTSDASNKFTATTNIANAKDGKAQKIDIKEQMAARASAGEVRNWDEIDLNKDNLVTPEEMENYLNKVWAAKKK